MHVFKLPIASVDKHAATTARVPQSEGVANPVSALSFVSVSRILPATQTRKQLFFTGALHAQCCPLPTLESDSLLLALYMHYVVN